MQEIKIVVKYYPAPCPPLLSFSSAKIKATDSLTRISYSHTPTTHFL